MRRLFLFPVILFLFSSCDDGDIIVSDFNFDSESSLNRCEFEGNRYVLHLITESNEAISFTFQQNILENIENVINPGSFSVPINSSNRINYRRLDANVDSNNYFCQEIPPSQPNVLEEFTSTSGGSAEFTINRVSGPNVDTDGDGIPDNQERPRDNNGNFTGSVFDLDTDNDGIPNFLDIDDDNDNVTTSVEIGGPNASDINSDTDEDGIPNYLDNDDDGDGVITRYEDLNALNGGTPPNQIDLNPRNDDTNNNGIPNFLDATVSESLTVDYFLNNTVSRRFSITVVFNNITLENINTERTIRLNSQGLGQFTFQTRNERIQRRN